VQLISTHFCKTRDVGGHGNLFGGVMLSWLDEAAATFACEVCDSPRMITKSIAEAVFQKPVRVGQIIKIYGEVVKIGTTSITVRLEARRHSVYNGTQRVVVNTQMIFIRIDGDGESIPISEKVRGKYSLPAKDEAKDQGQGLRRASLPWTVKAKGEV